MKAIRIICGIALIIIGTAGIFLPILPGWILIFVGIELVGIQIVFFDRIKAFAIGKIEKARKVK